jgi:uncharacterized membrane protein YozB (DUF420 family)
MQISDLPTVNAILNSTSALFLVCGYILIRSGRQKAHQWCMVGALTASGLFLTSYLIYHFQVGSRPFTGQGAIRSLYFAVLISHTLLAAAIVPLVLVTVRRAYKGVFEAHRGIARWTLPIWLYVSVTGVVVYWMLYRM